MRDAIHRKGVEPDLLGHDDPPAPYTERSSNDKRAPQLGEVLAYSWPLARAKNRKACAWQGQNQRRPRSWQANLKRARTKSQENYKNCPSPRHFRRPPCLG